METNNNKKVQGLRETHKERIHNLSIPMCVIWVAIVLHVYASIVKTNQIAYTSVA
jgi:hypothetical protein